MSVRFDASADAISRTANIPSYPITLLGWFRVSVDGNQVHSLFSFGNSGTGGEVQTFADFSGGTAAIMLYDGNASLTGSNVLTVGTWFHFGLVIQNPTDAQDDLLGYLNGALILTNADINDGVVTGGANTLRVGNNRDNEFLNGCAAAIKVYSGVELTPAEIAAEMRQYLPVRTANLNGWYPLWGNGDLTDYSGSANSWTVGGTLGTEDGPPIPWKADHKSHFIPAAAAPSGDIAGTAALVFGQAAALAGSGVLAGSATNVFGQTAVLAGAGTLAGQAPFSFSNAGVVLGAGALVGTVVNTFGEAAALTGAGSLAGSATNVFEEAALLLGTAPIDGSADFTFTASASAGGVAPIDGVVANQFGQAGVLSGGGALLGVCDVTFTPAAAVTGAGALLSNTTITFTPSATLTGAGTLAGQSAIVFTATGGQPATGLLLDLVSYWPMDEASGNALDAHGSNDLTDTNSVGTAAGKINTARDFHTNQYFSHTDNDELSLGADQAFTAQAWVLLDSKAARRGIVNKYGGGASSTVEQLIEYGDDVDRFRFILGNGSTSATVLADNLGSPSTGTWYHLIWGYDPVADELFIRVNGGTKNTTSYSGGTQNTAHPFEVGSLFTGGGSPMNGRIDEVAFWKRVLTDEEQLELYNDGDGFPYPFAPGAISATAAMTFTVSGTLLGAGALAGTAPSAFTPTGTLLGAGALVGSVAMLFTGQGALLGLAPLTGTAGMTFTLTGLALGPGALVGAAGITFTNQATPAGGGALLGSAALTFADSADLSGVFGAIFGTASMTFGGTPILIGLGALSGVVTVTFDLTGNLAGQTQGSPLVWEGRTNIVISWVGQTNILIRWQ